MTESALTRLQRHWHFCAKCKQPRSNKHCSYCRDCYAAYKRAWYQRHREKEITRALAYNKAHYAAHCRRVRKSWNGIGKITGAKYKKSNPDKIKAWDQKKRVRRIAAEQLGRGVTASDWRRIKKANGHACSYCGSICDLTMDHRVPLIRGGMHEPENITTACRSCNSKKNRRTEDEYRAILAGAV